MHYRPAEMVVCFFLCAALFDAKVFKIPDYNTSI